MTPEQLAQRVEELEEGQRRLIDLLTRTRMHCGEESDPSAAGHKSRAALELLCMDVVSRVSQDFKHRTGAGALDMMLGKLESTKSIPPPVRSAMRAVQHYGNSLIHPPEVPSPPGADGIMAKAALYSLSIVVQWYFSEFLPESDLQIADLVTRRDWRVVEVEIAWERVGAEQWPEHLDSNRRALQGARESGNRRAVRRLAEIVAAMEKDGPPGFDELRMTATITNIGERSLAALDLAVDMLLPERRSPMWRQRLPSPVFRGGLASNNPPMVVPDSRVPLHPGQSVRFNHTAHLPTGSPEALVSWCVYAEDTPPAKGELRMEFGSAPDDSEATD
jgi:hypothetical protein